MNARVLVASIGCTAVLGCGVDRGAGLLDASRDGALAEEPAIQASALRAASYLLGFEGEIGSDAVIALRSYGELADDEDVSFVATQRRALLPSAAQRELEPALDAELAFFLPPRTPTTQGPSGFAGDERDQNCPAAALRCEEPPECSAYLDTPGDGYGLTHQALTLVFARWAGCTLDDPRRHPIAHRLIAEQRSHPAPSDLSGERIAMLGELGYASSIERAWIDAFVEAQVSEGNANGAFRWTPDGDPAPHPTGMALWAYAQWFRAIRE